MFDWVAEADGLMSESHVMCAVRRYENIRAEVEAFFDVHEELGTVPGGIHLEMTGDNVTGKPRQALSLVRCVNTI